MVKKRLKLGLCILCGRRVHRDEDYLKSSDGYCHKECLMNSKGIRS
ncbi:MAG: hypothetical protein ABEI78_02095 [Candidatus Nanohaloarchaea archaeon]